MLGRMWKKGTLLHCWWECKLVQSLWKIVWRVLKKLKIEQTYNPTIPFLGICLKKTPLFWKDTCTPMFIAALFTIAKIWRQLTCPSTNEQINKIWFNMRWTISHKKEWNFSTWNNMDDLENMLSEVSKRQMLHDITLFVESKRYNKLGDITKKK